MRRTQVRTAQVSTAQLRPAQSALFLGVRISKKFLAGFPSRPFEVRVVAEPVQSRWLEDPPFLVFRPPKLPIGGADRAWIVRILTR